MKKPMLAAEQPPETEAEAAANAAAQDALVVETAAPPVPEDSAEADAKQADAMAAAWGTLRTAAEAPAPVPQTMTVPPIDPSRIDVPPGYKLVAVANPDALPNFLSAVSDRVVPGVVFPTRTLDDHQAAADDGLTAITVRLKPSVMQYLTERAAMFGEAPADHLARIVREFRLTDTQRPDLARLPGNEPGMPAMARPR